MKHTLIIILILTTLKGYNQTQDEHNYYFYIYQGKSKRTINQEDYEIIFINKNDTIITRNQAFYKIQYPFTETKLLIKYQDFNAEINTNLYFSSMFRFTDTIYIEIGISTLNKDNKYYIEYYTGISRGENFGEPSSRRQNRYWHQIIFSEIYRPMYEKTD